MSQKICIVGSGLIGRCWAVVGWLCGRCMPTAGLTRHSHFVQLFGKKGYRVVLYDIAEAQLTAAVESVKAQLLQLNGHGMLDGQAVEAVAERITTSTSLAEAVKDAIHIQVERGIVRKITDKFWLIAP